jgi:2-polyprenyl-6-methoxyphenol hydroxylase-like FAD-dependent oxidoreductase
MTTSTDRPVLIAGGGIGGLAAALALSRCGFRSLVLEKASALGEIGAGVQLGPNAFHALDCLGLGDEVRRIGIFVDALRLMDATTGEPLMAVDLGDGFRRRFGNPYAVVHRGELHRMLAEACAASDRIEIRTDAEVVGYEQSPGQVEALLANGHRVAGAALIGCDGLWSRVRRQLAGDTPPRVTGHTTFRSVIPIELVPEDLRWNAATLWAGPKCHIVHYPLSGWKLFNFAITVQNGATEAVSGRAVADSEVHQCFAHVHERAQAMLRHGRDWKYWVLCDREPLTEWVDGRVTLLGDAAHPTMQYLAQGACMAIEDAVCLADEVERAEGDVLAALQAYRDRRVVRTARIVLQSRAMGDHIYHPAGAHALVRNSLLKAKSQDDLHRDLAWLYDAAETGLPEAPQQLVRRDASPRNAAA